jgi:hypothetical protein
MQTSSCSARRAALCCLLLASVTAALAAPASAANAAALRRSVGGANYGLPHTGVTIWKHGQTRIPAAALAAEDGDLIERLPAQGPVAMKLVLTPQILPDADSANVIAVRAVLAYFLAQLPEPLPRLVLTED